MDKVFFLNGRAELVVLKTSANFDLLWREAQAESMENPWQGNPAGRSRNKFESVELDRGVTVEHRRGTIGLFEEFLVLHGPRDVLEGLYEDFKQYDSAN